jgi:hypothetical protein
MAQLVIAIATRSDTGSHNRLDLIQSLVPPHYVCNGYILIKMKVILCMTSSYFFRSFTNVCLLCFVSHSNGMTSCQSSSTENVSCNVTPFFYHHTSVVIHLVSDTLYQTGDFRHNIPDIPGDIIFLIFLLTFLFLLLLMTIFLIFMMA